MLTILCKFSLGKFSKTGSTAYKERALINHFSKKGWSQCGLEKVFYLQTSNTEYQSLTDQLHCQIKALQDIEELLTEKPWVKECFPDSFVLIGQCYDLSIFPEKKSVFDKEEINGSKDGGSPKKSSKVSSGKCANIKVNKPKISSPNIEITRNFTFNDTQRAPKAKSSPIKNGKLIQRSESFNGRNSDESCVTRNCKSYQSNGSISPKHTQLNGCYTNGKRSVKTGKHSGDDPMAMRVGIRSKVNSKSLTLSLKGSTPIENEADDDDFDSGDSFSDESDEETERVEEIDNLKFQVETLTRRSKVIRNNMKLSSLNLDPENHTREGMVV